MLQKRDLRVLVWGVWLTGLTRRGKGKWIDALQPVVSIHTPGMPLLIVNACNLAEVC